MHCRLYVFRVGHTFYMNFDFDCYLPLIVSKKQDLSDSIATAFVPFFVYF